MVSSLRQTLGAAVNTVHSTAEPAQANEIIRIAQMQAQNIIEQAHQEAQRIIENAKRQAK